MCLEKGQKLTAEIWLRIQILTWDRWLTSRKTDDYRDDGPLMKRTEEVA